MILTQKSDILGALASTICLIHCLITPLIFVAQTCSKTCCATAPTWWKLVDFIFLIISFFAVCHSTDLTPKSWLKISFWISWIGLALLIMNDHLHFFQQPHEAVYFPSLVLIMLHLYNRKQFKCSGDNCCA